MTCGNDEMCDRVHNDRRYLRQMLVRLLDACDQRPFAQQPHQEMMDAKELLKKIDE